MTQFWSWLTQKENHLNNFHICHRSLWNLSSLKLHGRHYWYVCLRARCLPYRVFLYIHHPSKRCDKCPFARCCSLDKSQMKDRVLIYTMSSSMHASLCIKLLSLYFMGRWQTCILTCEAWKYFKWLQHLIMQSKNGLSFNFVLTWFSQSMFNFTFKSFIFSSGCSWDDRSIEQVRRNKASLSTHL